MSSVNDYSYYKPNKCTFDIDTINLSLLYINLEGVHMEKAYIKIIKN